MRIERHGITGEDLTYLTDIGWSEVDSKTPLDDLIAADEAEDFAETFDAGELKSIPVDALLILLRFLIPIGSTSRKRWRVAQLRLCVLGHAAGLQGVGDKSLATLAEELGVTRSLLSHYATRLVDELGESQVRGGKCRESREVFRDAATNYHRRAGHKMRETSQEAS